MDKLEQDARKLLEELVPRSPSAAPGQNLLPPDTRKTAKGALGETPLWRAGPDGPASSCCFALAETYTTRPRD